MEQTWQYTKAREGVNEPRATSARAYRIGAVWLAPVLVALLAFATRAWAIGPSYDIFIDEVTYVRLVQSMGTVFAPILYGEPFYLHPPGFFVLGAAYWALFGSPSEIIAQIHSLRLLSAVCAAITAVALFMIARRLGGLLAGVIAALVFIADPFVNKMNSLVLLDTPALMWVSLGYLALLTALPTTARPGMMWNIARRKQSPEALAEDTTAIARWRIVAAGVAFGLALLTKDMTAFLTLLPLGIMFVVGWVLPRAQTFALGTITVLTYLPYPLAVAVAGDWRRFSGDKLFGFRRLAGAVQETGFNREQGPSLLDAIILRLTQFGTTYVLIAVGAVAILLLLWRGGAVATLLASWAISAYVLLVYCTLFGTLEEQFFYFLVVPVIAASAVALGAWAGRSRHFLARAVYGFVLCFFVSWGLVHWVGLRQVPSDGYAQVLQYVRTIATPDEKVAAIPETAQFLLEEHATGPWGVWYDPAAIDEFDPTFVLLDTKQITWSGTQEAVDLQRWLQSNGKPVWSMHTDRDRTLILYRIKP
jgi:hypothetical protein